MSKSRWCFKCADDKPLSMLQQTRIPQGMQIALAMNHMYVDKTREEQKMKMPVGRRVVRYEQNKGNLESGRDVRMKSLTHNSSQQEQTQHRHQYCDSMYVQVNYGVYFFGSSFFSSGFAVGNLNVSGVLSTPGPTCCMMLARNQEHPAIVESIPPMRHFLPRNF